jgi:hypothetical protein
LGGELMRRRMMMCSAGELPAGYTGLAYIQSSGTQYVVTDVIPKKTLTFKTTLEMLASHNQVIWGSRSTGDYTSDKTQMVLNKTVLRGGDIVFGNGGMRDESSPTVHFLNAKLLNVKYELVCGQNNPELYTGNAVQPLYIFALNSAGSPISYAQCKLYELIVYDSGNVYRRYIPVQRNADGMIGLFETETKTFLTNAGTGSFTGG